PRHLSDGATRAVTADEPGASSLIRSGCRHPPDLNAVVVLRDAHDFASAPYLDAEFRHPRGEKSLHALLVDPSHAPFGLARRVRSQWQKGEVPPRPVCVRPHLRSPGPTGGERAIFRLVQRRAHAPALERFYAERPD